MGPGQASHTQPEGAAGVAAGDLDAQTVDFGVIATARDAAQAAAHPAADAVVLVVGQLAAEHVVEVRDLGGRAHAPLVLALGEDGVFLGLVEFVLDVTDDLLQHVFHGDQAGDAAVLVDDDGLVVAADAEFAQQHVQALGFGNEDRRADQRAHLDAGFQHAAQQVLGQQDADDVVAVAFVDGKARVGGLDDRGDQVRDGLGDVQQVHARARHHDVGHDAFGHGQRAPDHLVGLGVQQGAFVGGFQDGLDAFAVLGLSAHEGKQAVHQGFGCGFCGASRRRVGSRIRVRHRPGWTS